MRHIDVFVAVDIENDKDLGVVTICPLPGYDNRYAYYFRTPSDEYRLLVELGSLSVTECRTFERTELKNFVQEHLGILREDQWKFYRSRPTIWDDSSILDPEVTNPNWLLAMEYEFED